MREMIGNVNKQRYKMKNIDGSPQWWRGMLIKVGETIITDTPLFTKSFKIEPLEEKNKTKVKEE